MGVRKALGIKELRGRVIEVGRAFIWDDNLKGNGCQGAFTLQVIRMEGLRRERAKWAFMRADTWEPLSCRDFRHPPSQTEDGRPYSRTITPADDLVEIIYSLHIGAFGSSTTSTGKGSDSMKSTTRPWDRHLFLNSFSVLALK